MHVSVFALVSGSEPAEAPKWKPITLVTISIVCFALLFERAGMLPALVALVAMMQRAVSTTMMPITSTILNPSLATVIQGLW